MDYERGRSMFSMFTSVTKRGMQSCRGTDPSQTLSPARERRRRWGLQRIAKTAPARILLLLLLLLLATDASAQAPGFGIIIFRFNTVDAVGQGEGFDRHLQVWKIAAPAEDLARVLEHTWPPDAPPLPGQIRQLRLVLEDATGAERPESDRVESLFRSCGKMALLAQAKEGYQLDIQTILPSDLNGISQLADGALQLDLSGNRVTCTVRRLPAT